MTVDEALQQMHHYCMWESHKQPDHINLMLDQWADAIEGELKALREKVEKLGAAVRNVEKEMKLATLPGGPAKGYFAPGLFDEWIAMLRGELDT